MSILSWLQGSRPAGSNFQVTQNGSLSFIDVASHRFHGQCKTSPNGRYIIAWRDGNDAGTRGGARTEGKGRYLLIDGQTVVADGRMERPNDGCVADNGAFALNDWRFFSNELRGTFYAFRADGSEILRRKFLANLYNCGISREGRFACCQTCNSSSERDSAVLTIFDLEKAAEIASWPPESGWAMSYEFNDDGASVALRYREGPPLRYTLTGEFVDRLLWIESALDRGDLYMVDRVIKETHPKPEGEWARRLMASAEKGIAAIRADDQRTRAFGLKLKANCLEGLQEWQAALTVYEEALSFDPKIGVKRRIEQLRKKLAPI